MKAILSFLFLLFVGISALATDFGFLPNGHREAFLANTGGALEGSPGNFLFNPAGMGFRDLNQLNLSVGGSALSSFQFDIPSFNNEVYDMDKQELSLRPMNATAVYPTRWGTVGLFVAVPSVVDFLYTSHSDNGTIEMNQLVRARNQTLLAGAGLASRFNSRVAWGVSAGLRVVDATTYFHYTFRGAAVGMGYSESSEKSLNLFVIPGLLIKPNELWTVGLSAYVLPLKFSSSAKVYSNSINSGAPTNIINTSKSYDPSTGDVPYSVRMGHALQISSAQTLNYDVVFLSSTSRRNDLGAVTSEASYFSHSVGYRNAFSSSWEGLAGYMRSESGNSVSHLMTLGGVFINRRSEIGLGVFYAESNPNDSGDRQRRNSSAKAYGLMFSSSVAY